MARRRTKKYKVRGKIGTGVRYRRLKSSLSRKGARNPGALAAYIGRKKYGKRRYAKMAAAGRRRKRRRR